MILSTKCKISVHLLPGRHYTYKRKRLQEFEFEKEFVNLSKFEVEKGFVKVCFGGFSSDR